MTSRTPLVPLFFLTACQAATPASSGTVIATHDLVAVLGDLAAPVGVTLDPDSGTLYVLDAWEGVYALTDTGFQQHLTSDDLTVTGGVDQRPYTDVAAMGDGRFAVSVRSDGLLYDPAVGGTVQHFCYEPGDTGLWAEEYQHTNSLGYDAGRDRLIATPQTIQVEDDLALEAFVAEFDGQEGTPLHFWSLDDAGFAPGAVAVQAGGSLLLAHGDTIYSYEAGAVAADPLVGLAGLGVTRIEGLAVDATSGDLWVVDGERVALLRISGWR